MFHQTNTTERALRHGLGLVAIFVTLSLSLSANGVLAARGGRTPTGTVANATMKVWLQDTPEGLPCRGGHLRSTSLLAASRCPSAPR